MKFSIQFKYQNVNFKNTKTKETISFETKAQDGNTFIFDNVDEDVVIGILKGVKDKKASSVFGYDDFRTNFINTMARNKCKELYDKMDKEGWKVEDIVVSGITLKDLEFTKPTMNARENITVESKMKQKIDKMRIQMEASSEEKMDEKCNEILKELEDEFSEILDDDNACFDISTNDEGKRVVEVSIDPNECEHIGYKVNSLYEELKEFVINLGCSIKNEWRNNDNWGFEAEPKMEKYDDTDQMKFAFETNEENEDNRMEQVDVIFKKDRRNKDIIAFFPDTMYDGSCNPGNLMSYAHMGQHSEASIDYYNMCRPATEEEYAPLLKELEDIYDDCHLHVVRKITKKHYRR